MLADQIRKLCKETKITQREIAKRLYVSPQAVSKWARNESTPNPEALADLAALFGVTVDELLGGEPSETTPKACTIPVLGLIPAGIPVEAVEDIQDYEDIPAEWAVGGRQYFGLKVKGDSMYPRYLEGDTVILRKTRTCDSGDDCAVMINGNDSTLKKVYLHEDGSLEIKPINTTYPPRTFTPEEVATLPVTIAGVVVELRRKIK